MLPGWAVALPDPAGAKVVPLAPAVGSVKGADGYIETIDYNVRSIAQALR